ncbi:hypothetical protein [Pseudogulbenkiania subflava]|uniref:Uncharacterized protein n=1 Tax=Pseudogulbenkiania subflava DSM 22618 TaxID=1123014 RepID=A0A1Y6C2E1_9NEIS|nr:hypothetical protein [Pseudogulbenkiania subflava]SMF29910.1 hypothetical protein SAMN02745746_02442 [Pseudogulbenkiania subflava DSM 22618]
MTYTNVWAYLKNVPNIVGILATFVGVLLTIAGSLIAALIAARVSLRNAKRTLAQGQDTLAVQRLVTNRATASFIADKRQKWIDELRSDVATHLAQSQEVVWKWDALRARIQEIKNDQLLTKEEQIRTMTSARHEFSKSNGELDRQHQERHIRLRLRLNPKEPDHITLRHYLNDIRKNMTAVASAQVQEMGSTAVYIIAMQELVQQSEELTQTILKTEWTRVKQEVAYPEETLSKIPLPSAVN